MYTAGWPSAVRCDRGRLIYSGGRVLRAGTLDDVLASVLEQTSRARGRPPPVLFLRTGGGWQLMGLLVVHEEELRTCLLEASEIDSQENVDAFVCVAACGDARRISEHLRLENSRGRPEDAHERSGDLLFCAGSLAGERVSGVTGPDTSWAPAGRPDARAERLCAHLAGLLL